MLTETLEVGRCAFSVPEPSVDCGAQAWKSRLGCSTRATVAEAGKRPDSSS